MDPIEERRGISSMGSNPRPIYQELQPPDHTRVCFAAAIGSAMRGRYAENGEAVGRLALAMLADGTAPCISSKPRTKRSRR